MLAAALLAGTCSPVGIDLNAVVAIQVGVADSAVVEEGDTIVPFAIAYNGRGDSVQADVVWAAIDTALLLVVDSSTGVTVGKKPAPAARLQARVGALRSALLSLAVRPQADTLFAPGARRDTVTVSTSPDSLSIPLELRLQADTGGVRFDLTGRRVLFVITYPAAAAGFTLDPTDSALTGAGGLASVRARLVNRVLPDSVVVQALARRTTGELVPGSPVTFVVEYVP